MERSFKTEVEALKLGDGDTFHGEGILAVTKALLQSGVSYVGGYQGSPISHLIDVLVDAKPLMDQLGVHLETSTSEAAAGAMLAASINYPIRGAVTWKSPVGTNVASDGLSNIVVRRHRRRDDHSRRRLRRGRQRHPGAQPRLRDEVVDVAARPAAEPDLDRQSGRKRFRTVGSVELHVMMQVRIRTCHVYGRFAAKDNREGEILAQSADSRSRNSP